MNLLWESNFGDSGHVSQRDSSPFFNLMFSPPLWFFRRVKADLLIKESNNHKVSSAGCHKGCNDDYLQFNHDKTPTNPTINKMGLLREALSEDQEPTPTTSKGSGRGGKAFGKEKKKISFASLCSFQCLELIKAVKKKNQLKMSIMKELLSHRTQCPFFFFSVITQEFPS